MTSTFLGGIQIVIMSHCGHTPPPARHVILAPREELDDELDMELRPLISILHSQRSEVEKITNPAV